MTEREDRGSVMTKKACADGPNVLHNIYILLLCVAEVEVDGRVYTSSGNLIRVWHFRQIGGNLKVLLSPSSTPSPPSSFPMVVALS